MRPGSWPRIHACGGVDAARPVGVDGDAGAAEFGGEVDRVSLEGGLGLPELPIER
jgi:hypothetical protein